jgi:hypothetical protein
MRLSVRLSPEEVETWGKLRAKYPGKKDSFIFHELMRAEGFRQAGHTKDDKLDRIIELLGKLVEDDNRIIELLSMVG